MINISKISKEPPYTFFKKYYDQALSNDQKNIEAISISSFNCMNNEVESRFVNLKYINEDQWIFFTNYNSKKSIEFMSHDQISALLFWNSINVQVRIKAKIKKTSYKFSNNHFKNRDFKKNAVAISSKQSQKISSYAKVIDNYEKALETVHEKNCPSDWGGYTFTPYYFEFWVGNDNRLNDRTVYEKIQKEWQSFKLQP